MQYRIIDLSQKKLHDYSGMNHSAAIAMGFKPVPKVGDIYRSNKLSNSGGEQVEKHEVVEDIEMRRGKKYFPSHIIALTEQEKSWNQIGKDLHIQHLRHFIQKDSRGRNLVIGMGQPGQIQQQRVQPTTPVQNPGIFGHNSGIQSETTRRALAILPPALVYQDIRDSGARGWGTIANSAKTVFPMPVRPFNPTPEEAQQRRDTFFGWMYK